MSGTNPEVDAFLEKSNKWQEEFRTLREIILDCGLKEELKWMHPCYTLQNKNIVLMHGFKEYCALLFFKGALLEDPDGILVQQTENVQSQRQIRFTSADEISGMAQVIRNYIRKAMEVEKSGKKIVRKKTSDYPVPEEFQSRLDQSPELKDAFESLTPGRQRAYLFYFSSAKQSGTRRSRVDKYEQKILDGKGMND